MEDRVKKIFVYGTIGIAGIELIYFLLGFYYHWKNPENDPNFILFYIIFAVALLVLFWVICLLQKRANKNNRTTAIDDIIDVFTKYRFLLKQLVSKEFKLKYRRSYLGIAWSLINPFLTMIVISAVFSYMFRFNIPNFPAYLILGQITFNFFSEASQLSLLSIVNSGQLIKKVYMPKYIFPLSRVVSSFVNYLLTFIPAIIVLLYYKIWPNSLTIIYLPLFLVYYSVFTYGIGLILASLDVFMRDIQHLYGVFITALAYATPIFYSIDNLSPKMKSLMQFNPIYHFITYIRQILFYHVCPTVLENVICIALALLSLTIGMVVFLKKQKKFILYI